MRIFIHGLALLAAIIVVGGCAYDQPGTHASSPTTTNRQVISSYPAGTSGTYSSGTTTYPVYRTTPGYGVSDETLAADVRRVLTSSLDSTLSQNVQVTAQNGVVTLSGRVPSQQDLQRIETIARNTTGVAEVHNLLAIGTPVLTPTGTEQTRVYTPNTAPPVSPMASTVSTGDIFNLHVQGLNDADRTLAQRILDGLRTDTVLPTLLPVVDINVSGGQVTLNGSVQNATQRQSIEDAIRRAAGASNVRSDIQITTGVVPLR